jgi:DNA-binding response OmpR family regulator
METKFESPVTPGKARILIVEGRTSAAMMMVHVLSRAGCDVLVASTGEKGMELAQESKFDLITLNVDLPDASGFEICSELKQRHYSRHTPIIFISERPCEKDRQHGLKLGAVDYIAKPFEVTDFIFRIMSHAKTKSRQSDFPDQNPHPDTQSLCNTP